MPETVLQLKDASIYQGDSLVLSNVNFEMEKGDFVYLIGKTGTGKSSFMKTLYGDLELTEGEGSIVDFNLIVNNGEIAGQLIKHFHLHILPRKKGDGVVL
mgnify:CR=1 FL=1